MSSKCAVCVYDTERFVLTERASVTDVTDVAAEQVGSSLKKDPRKFNARPNLISFSGVMAFVMKSAGLS